MKTLEKAGPQLTSGLKGDWIGLYRSFLSSTLNKKKLFCFPEHAYCQYWFEEDFINLTFGKYTLIEIVPVNKYYLLGG